jgi:hypothetical protein
MLSTIITVSVFVIVITYVVYEVPSILSWFSAGTVFDPVDDKPPPPQRKTQRISRTQRAKPKKISPAPPPVAVGEGVDVRSLIEKDRDTVNLNVDIENNSDHKIEMVVVDINLPIGIDTMTGSFRMQRIGTIESGDSRRCTFRLNHTSGSLSDITGHVEFMSSSYEITEVVIPSPEIA